MRSGDAGARPPSCSRRSRSRRRRSRRRRRRRGCRPRSPSLMIASCRSASSPLLVAAAAGAEQLRLRGARCRRPGPGRRSCPAPGWPSASPAPRCTRRAQRGTGAARPSWRRAARGSQPSTSSRIGPATAGSVARGRAEPIGPPGRSARRERRPSARPPSGRHPVQSAPGLPMTKGRRIGRAEEGAMRTGLPFDDVLAAAQAGAAWAFEVLYRDLAPVGHRLSAAARRGRARRPGQRDLHRRLHRPGRLQRRRGRAARLGVHHRPPPAGRRLAAPQPPSAGGRRPRRPHRAASAATSRTTSWSASAPTTVHRLCAELPDDQRSVLLLRILADLTVEQVAAGDGPVRRRR